MSCGLLLLVVGDLLELVLRCRTAASPTSLVCWSADDTWRSSLLTSLWSWFTSDCSCGLWPPSFLALSALSRASSATHERDHAEDRGERPPRPTPNLRPEARAVDLLGQLAGRARTRARPRRGDAAGSTTRRGRLGRRLAGRRVVRAEEAAACGVSLAKWWTTPPGRAPARTGRCRRRARASARCRRARSAGAPGSRG